MKIMCEDGISDYLTRLSNAESAKRIAITIVTIKRVFSKPRRVWKAELKLSLPPNAPPMAAPVCCSKIAATRMIASTICIYGSRDEITFIGKYYIISKKKDK